MHDWDWAVNMVGETDHLNYWEEQKYWYNNAMGRYASTAMLTTTNFWFSIANFKWFAFIQLLFLIGSLVTFVRTLFESTSTRICIQISMILVVIYLHGMESVFEGFYLLSSNVTYQMAAGISLLFFTALIKKNRATGKAKLVWLLLAAILIITIVGMNEMSMLILAGVFLPIVFFRFLANRQLDIADVVLVLILLVSAFIEISAPGNYTRMTYYEGSKNLPLAIGLSLSSGFFLFIKWLTTSLLLPVTLLFVSFQPSRQSTNNKLYNYPNIATALLLLIPIGCLFPIFWSMGMETLPDRVVDTIFLFFIIAWFIMIGAWMKYFSERELFSFQIPKFLQIGLSVFIVFNLFFSGIDLNKDKAILSDNTGNKLFKLFTVQSNIGNAWKDLISGDAYSYHLDQQNILKKVKDENAELILVDKLKHEPNIIYSKKYDRKASYGDQFMGHFYGKKCVVKYD